MTLDEKRTRLAELELEQSQLVGGEGAEWWQPAIDGLKKEIAAEEVALNPTSPAQI